MVVYAAMFYMLQFGTTPLLALHYQASFYAPMLVPRFMVPYVTALIYVTVFCINISPYAIALAQCHVLPYAVALPFGYYHVTTFYHTMLYCHYCVTMCWLALPHAFIVLRPCMQLYAIVLLLCAAICYCTNVPIFVIMLLLCWYVSSNVMMC